MNVSNIITMNYKNFIPLAGQKNKPNSKPILERMKRMNLNFCVPLATAENCIYHISSLEVTIGDD